MSDALEPLPCDAPKGQSPANQLSSPDEPHQDNTEVAAASPVSDATRRPLITRRQALVAAGLATGAGLAVLTGTGPALVNLVQAARRPRPVTGSTFAFDTYCSFTVYGDDTAPAKLSAACARYDALFNLYDEGSDIARINRAGGAPTVVDPETAAVIARALELSTHLDGLFDISIGAVSTLWDFHTGIRPSDEAIAAALPHVGWRGIHVDEPVATVTLDDPAAKLDLGGIAKGFVADRLCELIRTETDASAAVISLGGNIAYVGGRPDGSPWTTGIRDPNEPGGDATVGTARTAGGTFVTSGLYERTFSDGGATYWHILDPNTGRPVQTDVVSDTVFGPSSTAADALSTALFVAGSARGAKLVDSIGETAAYFILADGDVAESSRWQELTGFEA
ncbi:MAG: FAD:protein FMN transferase [Coriobacteriaceae bacterium]|nr:FAD:protein FMN transferase [Coriobacteriaceae bacterium]